MLQTLRQLFLAPQDEAFSDIGGLIFFAALVALAKLSNWQSCNSETVDQQHWCSFNKSLSQSDAIEPVSIPETILMYLDQKGLPQPKSPGKNLRKPFLTK
jgi:hypothetical protein